MKHHILGAVLLAGSLLVPAAASWAAPEAVIAKSDADKMVEAIFDDGADCGPRLADGRCAPNSDRRQIVFGDSAKRVATKLPPVRKFQLPVNFELGSAQLTATSRQTLDRIAASYKKRAADLGAPAAIFVDGFTDHIGNCEFNLKLSQARAAAAVEYLAGLGIDRKLMTPRGFGYSQLKYPDQPVSPANRRVEVVRDRGEISGDMPSCG